MDIASKPPGGLTHAERIKMAAGLAALAAVFVAAGLTGGGNGPVVFGLRAEFFLFGITLAGVALLHQHTLPVALTGLAAILLLKFCFTNFHLGHHLAHEWTLLLNLLGLLLGFALLARHFEDSH